MAEVTRATPRKPPMCGFFIWPQRRICVALRVAFVYALTVPYERANMTTQTTDKVRKAFKLLMKPGATITIKDAALKAGCSRSAIYRSVLYKDYMQHRMAKYGIRQTYTTTK